MLNVKINAICDKYEMFYTFREPTFSHSEFFLHIAPIYTFSVDISSYLATFSHLRVGATESIHALRR